MKIWKIILNKQVASKPYVSQCRTVLKGSDYVVYGAINEKGEKYYTYLKKVFDAIDNKQKEYNWLITDCVCYPNNQKIEKLLNKEYCWLSGEELTEMATYTGENGEITLNFPTAGEYTV